MEGAGLAVGIVPLVVGALKAYHAVHQYLRIFRRYASEIKRLFVRFNVQQSILESELDLLLRKARLYGPKASPTSAAELLAQHDCGALARKLSGLDDALRQLLGKHADTFISLLVGIAEQLQELQNELKCFDAVKAHQDPEETLRQTVQRVKARVKIGFDKRRLGELLEALRNDNEDLRSIVSYFTEERAICSYRREVQSMPEEVLRNRRVVSALHETLTSCWTCVDPDHGEHVAKLCLSSHAATPQQQSSEARFDLAVACLPKPHTNTQQSVVPAPIWLYVRTTTEILKAPDSKDKKRRKFDSTASSQSRTLLRHDSVCESLSKCQCNGKASEACLSYLQPARGLRHLFYHHSSPSSLLHSSNRSMALSNVVSEIRTELTMDQQLALAQRLACSMLELYKSPWLPKQWRINDISSFSKPSSDDYAFVQQLHVTSAISGQAQLCSATTPSHWAIADPTGAQDANSLLYGISNNTLFSLGIALLEIAHGKPLEDFRRASDSNLLCTAYRLLERGCPLGERYRELARQCIRCDFGCGSELELRGLQDAVYADVVGQLESLVTSLQI